MRVTGLAVGCFVVALVVTGSSHVFSRVAAPVFGFGVVRRVGRIVRRVRLIVLRAGSVALGFDRGVAVGCLAAVGSAGTARAVVPLARLAERPLVEASDGVVPRLSARRVALVDGLDADEAAALAVARRATVERERREWL